MQVYRIEDPKTHVGPYRNDVITPCSFPDIYDTETHPAPQNVEEKGTPLRAQWQREYEDGHPDWRPDLHFGFASKEQMLAWFPLKVRKHVKAHDYVVRVLDVPDEGVYLGNKQVAFERGQSTVAATLDPVTLEPLP